MSLEFVVVGTEVHLVDLDGTHTTCGIFLLDPDVQQYPTDGTLTCQDCWDRYRKLMTRDSQAEL